MELRHLRYFVAVAETKSVSLAASKKLHTTQPSLSRQIRDLEDEVGTPLLTRTVRGVELTSAGRVFLDHARSVLAQVESGIEAARRLAVPAKQHFVLGFLSGHESTWLPAALQILRGELPNTHVVISSQNSPQLAVAISEGRVDAAILRREEGSSDLVFHHLIAERLEVYMPSDHRLASRDDIALAELVGETFLSISGKALGSPGHAPALRIVIDEYIKRSGLDIKPSHEVDHLAGIMSLIASTGGVALLPTYAKNLLPSAVTCRPLRGNAPTVDLAFGYKKGNKSPILKVLVDHLVELIANASNSFSLAASNAPR
jgi:LysR family transcriptional regulator, hca operon transcriptional activator